MADVILQTVPLDFRWPTVDPFLFCVHHLDHYPAANAHLGPDAPLEARDIGNDFAGLEGWRMYHGATVPGFPQHPHRGFETVTFVRQGLVDHTDSLGATARYGRGDVQWLTAGGGIVHSEMFPLTDQNGPNTLELFQIWINLPRADKLAEPHFTMLWDEDIPRVNHVDGAGRRTEITVVAGELSGSRPLSPPPSSWASRDGSDVAIWHVASDAAASWTLPPAGHDDTVRTVYVFAGSLGIDGTEIETSVGVVVQADEPVEVTAGATGAEALVLQGRPIAEPVAQYGPFVMNDRAGIEQAFTDYRETGFGGWPWTVDDPVHDALAGRFARRADGRVEHPTPVGAGPGEVPGPGLPPRS